MLGSMWALWKPIVARNFLWMVVAIVVRFFSVFFARFCHVSEHAKNDRFALCRVPFLVGVRDRFLGASEVTFGTSFW